jgi:hypothetical protein
MIKSATRISLTILPLVVFACGGALASTVTEPDDSTVVAVAEADGAEGTDSSDESTELSYLVPELKDAGFRLAENKPSFWNRVSFSPGIGQLGTQTLFSFRAGFNPNTWLGYEIALAHNPASSLHAMLHTFNVILRYPIPWRAQPYATLGYGMMTVYPGKAINADPVTKNTLTAGGGLEFYIRNDVALRGEVRSATVMGRELNSEGTVAYSYREYTLGFTFYRGLGK